MKTGTRFLTVATAAAALGALASQADAGFMSQFDTISPGVDANGANGWQGWNNIAADAGVISDDIAYEGPNSLLIKGYTDAVQTYTGATSGVWSMQAKQYIASGQSGLQYFIILNTYTDGGMNNAGYWSTQLKFNLASGTLSDDFRGGSLPIAFNQWSDLRIDINLDSNTVDSYYNNVLLSSGSWTRNGASHLGIAALDLYSADNNKAYYDNVALAEVPAPSVPGALAISVAAVIIPMRRRRWHA